MGCHFLLQGIFLTQGLNDGSCIFTPEPSGKPYLSCSEAKKKTKKRKQKSKQATPYNRKQQKRGVLRCLIFTCSHPDSWLLFNCLSFLAQFFPREAPLCIQHCPVSLSSWICWVWLGKERERILEGWRSTGSEFPALAPSPLLPGPSHGQAHSRRASWRKVSFRVSHSRLYSASTVTPLPARPGAVMVPALASAWTLTLLLLFTLSALLNPVVPLTSLQWNPF